MRPSSFVFVAFAFVAVSACSETPTGPPAESLSPLATSVSLRDNAPLASSRWQLTARGLVKARSASPIVAARAYALVSLGQYAAVDAADALVINGRDANDHAKAHARRGAIAATSAKVLSYLFPLDVAQILTQLQTESAEGTVEAREAFARGREEGQTVGDLIVTRGRGDGFAQANGSPLVWDPSTLRTGTGVWSMDTDAAPQVPAGFQFAGIRPYFLENANQFRPAPPDLSGQVDEVIEIVEKRTIAQAALAVALNQSSGTFTTPGVFAELAANFIDQHHMDDRAAAHVYALMHTAVMDAVIACWEAKFEYLVMRPWQVAPLGLPRSVLIIGRPNHPSYPSGHSCVSGAAATVLERFFPAQRAVLEKQVEDNGMSRIYAGIHYRIDVEAGQQLGRSVAQWAVRIDQRKGLLSAVLSP
jgi:membrane-associated phospholipid phosphatase